MFLGSFTASFEKSPPPLRRRSYAYIHFSLMTYLVGDPREVSCLSLCVIQCNLDHLTKGKAQKMSDTNESWAEYSVNE